MDLMATAAFGNTSLILSKSKAHPPHGFLVAHSKKTKSVGVMDDMGKDGH